MKKNRRNKHLEGTAHIINRIVSVYVLTAVLFSLFLPVIPANAASAEENVIFIHTESACLTVDLDDNAAAQELKDMLAQGDLTIQMTGNSFEQYGNLGRRLSANDVQITAQPGDVLLYNADTICVFYGTNRYSYTRIGTVRGMDSESLRELLSGKDLTMTLSLRPDTSNAQDAVPGDILVMIRLLIQRILQFLKNLTAGFAV